jgi:S1-C subfamily serine protease
VQPGNSGGALVDERGNVVGVVAAKLSASATLKTTGALPENVNYAIKHR